MVERAQLKLESITHIPLPWKDNTVRILHVDLTAAVEVYANSFTAL